MPRDSQGAYSLVPGTLVNSGDTVLVSQHNPAFQDVATALTNSVDRDGKGGMRAPLNMGGFRITNAAPGVAPTDLATIAQASVPVGTVLDFAGATAPDGYLLCYGQAIARADYPALFTAIGVVYGPGDGVTTFNIPDLRGVVCAGKGDMGGTLLGRLSNFASTVLGAVFGNQSHTLTVPEIPSHTHDITDPGHTHIYTRVRNGTGRAEVAGGMLDNAQDNTGTLPSATGITINNAGGGAAHNNTQPTIIFNKIIKAGNS